ncbi:MAG: hypothetical protein IT306_02700 [Chloroflexi bacterium]|nr:hypothetical protein [Chloroflexota bacterium]
MRDGITIRPRVLLVTDDDRYSAQLKARLSGMIVLSLPEASVWVALRAGLSVTRGAQAVLLDRGVTGRLLMQLYEVLRPADGQATTPVIFVRSRLTAASGGFDHELDVYQPEDATIDQTGRLVRHMLSLTGVDAPHETHGVASQAPAATHQIPPRVAARLRSAVAVGPGVAQRAGLWGVAAALIGFTFWPLLGSGPVRDAVFGPVKAFSSESGKVAASLIKARTAR